MTDVFDFLGGQHRLVLCAGAYDFVVRADAKTLEFNLAHLHLIFSLRHAVIADGLEPIYVMRALNSAGKCIRDNYYYKNVSRLRANVSRFKNDFGYDLDLLS